jgi:hypothetical protein
MPSKENPWFRAKRYGYGWGLPLRWQGWFVLLGYFILLIPASWFLRQGGDASYFIVYVMAASVALVFICWWKGEPARWRWGRD